MLNKIAVLSGGRTLALTFVLVTAVIALSIAAAHGSFADSGTTGAAVPEGASENGQFVRQNDDRMVDVAAAGGTRLRVAGDDQFVWFNPFRPSFGSLCWFVISPVCKYGSTYKA